MGNTEVFMRQLGLRAVREQKLLVARKTGNLGRSIHLVATTAHSATTEASANYAGYVEHGTRPHEITPKVARVLAWAPGAAGGAFRRLSGATRKGVKAGAMVFAMKVHHPGTKAQPFMVPGAMLAAKKMGASIVIDEWNGAA
jgi:hypothetical protein